MRSELGPDVEAAIARYVDTERRMCSDNGDKSWLDAKSKILLKMQLGQYGHYTTLLRQLTWALSGYQDPPTVNELRYVHIAYSWLCGADKALVYELLRAHMGDDRLAMWQQLEAFRSSLPHYLALPVHVSILSAQFEHDRNKIETTIAAHKQIRDRPVRLDEPAPCTTSHEEALRELDAHLQAISAEQADLIKESTDQGQGPYQQAVHACDERHITDLVVFFRGQGLKLLADAYFSLGLNEAEGLPRFWYVHLMQEMSKKGLSLGQLLSFSRYQFVCNPNLERWVGDANPMVQLYQSSISVSEANVLDIGFADLSSDLTAVQLWERILDGAKVDLHERVQNRFFANYRRTDGTNISILENGIDYVYGAVVLLREDGFFREALSVEEVACLIGPLEQARADSTTRFEQALTTGAVHARGKAQRFFMLMLLGGILLIGGLACLEVILTISILPTSILAIVISSMFLGFLASICLSEAVNIKKECVHKPYRLAYKGAIGGGCFLMLAAGCVALFMLGSFTFSTLCAYVISAIVIMLGVAFVSDHCHRSPPSLGTGSAKVEKAVGLSEGSTVAGRATLQVDDTPVSGAHQKLTVNPI